ncbi:abnormal spindle-like microcephaly-associated protein homolog isoform X1 [Cucurbita pepo subsp. pepo]|uniref:abnormal spindle-like microcephaly-associated protein homolog isoform X1 n=1 Tax=Cucurbita pepo subsp. pepo TaxID=3664 RepID=UPI000C9D32EF|nr:abnormal spindle-like microcephaly-associated protein homolog isoform X1 [Cucurbita pepo subsp. pepo]
MEGEELPCPSPSPFKPPPSSIFKDISNFKTPKRQSRISNLQSPCQHFFTASKRTPLASSSIRRPRPSLAPSSSAARSKASRKLKAFELEQSQSSRKAQVKKEQSLKSLANSLTVWLNFLFENPRSCGCDGPVGDNGRSTGPRGKGKRDCNRRAAVGVDMAWRCPKRQRDLSWGSPNGDVAENEVEFSNSRYVKLRESLKDVCSFDDLTQRMRVYLSSNNCKDTLDIMAQVTKNIDDGRLKMKAHCPIVTDVGLKESTTRILMSYNPIWLHIGLYIIFGGDSLLSTEDVNSEQDNAFLKMVLGKQFFSHSGLAKTYSYNRMVEGLYRPGYYEALGNIILKRFLLLVLILDKAKCQSSLPLEYGIDGVDGGSPLLFIAQSVIKSSRQMINDFLSSNVMHGEGNLVAHLVIMGYKVSYTQLPISDYDFKITNLFVDIQDGVRLCRAIQLLLNDYSILTKIVVPSDTHKKNLTNCSKAIQYLKQAGVALRDEDGMIIVEDDIANGDKEMILSLLSNMFVHLQLPLIVNKNLLVEEVCKIRGVEKSEIVNSTPLEVLLNWIQVVCENYDIKISNFSSLVNGKAIWCLLDYYFRKDLHCSSSPKIQDPQKMNGEESIMSVTHCSDSAHNLILLQKLTSLLGDFPEILQISDILEYGGACSDRSVIILLTFLASELIVKKSVDLLNFHKLLDCDCQSPNKIHFCSRQYVLNSVAAPNIDGFDVQNTGETDGAKKFKTIRAWWQDMVEQNKRSFSKPDASSLFLPSRKEGNQKQKEDAARIIQSYYRRLVERRKFINLTDRISFLQRSIKAWLIRRRKLACTEPDTAHAFQCERPKQLEVIERYSTLTVYRCGLSTLQRSAICIQRATRNWMIRKKQISREVAHLNIDRCDRAVTHLNIASIADGDIGIRDQIKEASELQIVAEECPILNKDVVVSEAFCKHLAATQIQSYFRGWLLRRQFLSLRRATIVIQKNIRMLRSWKEYKHYKNGVKSALVIQSSVRGWIARREGHRHRRLVIQVQSFWRRWLARKNFLLQRQSIIKIQTATRCMITRIAFRRHRHAAIEIQRHLRGQIARKKLLGAASELRSASNNGNLSRGSCNMFELKLVSSSILKLQRWWKGVLLLRLRSRSAIVIQSHVRGWISRRRAATERHHIVLIQSHWKGHLARKRSRGQLRDLRLRVQNSAANVDDGKRIINRLVVALTELLSMRSVRGILHTCATLDMATGHSQKCCETLVAAGAISTLLKLIRSVSRSIPDQEVLKHALSTLRNLSRYPHLIEVLIDTHGSVEILLWELLRNKEDGFFIASEVLKRICRNEKGIEAVRKSSALLKRLNSLAEELARKASNEKRNARGLDGRESIERRLKEAVELLKLITNGNAQPRYH